MTPIARHICASISVFVAGCPPPTSPMPEPSSREASREVGQLEIEAPEATIHINGLRTGHSAPTPPTTPITLPLGDHAIGLETPTQLCTYRISVERSGPAHLLLKRIGGAPEGTVTAILVGCWGSASPGVAVKTARKPVAARTPERREPPPAVEDTAKPVAPEAATAAAPGAATPVVAASAPATPPTAPEEARPIEAEAPPGTPPTAEEIEKTLAALAAMPPPDVARPPIGDANPTHSAGSEGSARAPLHGGVSNRVPRLAINSVPTARVIIDGEDTGRTTPIWPQKPLELKPGVRRLTLVTEGGDRYSYAVTIPENPADVLKLVIHFDQRSWGTVTFRALD